jgi:prevent-host-death family protein
MEPEMWSLRRYDDHMEEVGVRELKASLSRYLSKVKDGGTIVVTERGRPIARIVPVAIPEHIAGLIARGTVTWSGKPFHPPKKPFTLKPGPPVSDYISEDRR